MARLRMVCWRSQASMAFGPVVMVQNGRFRRCRACRASCRAGSRHRTRPEVRQTFTCQTRIRGTEHDKPDQILPPRASAVPCQSLRSVKDHNEHRRSAEHRHERSESYSGGCLPDSVRDKFKPDVGCPCDGKTAACAVVKPSHHLPGWRFHWSSRWQTTPKRFPLVRDPAGVAMGQ